MYREQNQIADLMTKEGIKSGRFEDTKIFIVPPALVCNQLGAENLGTSYFRKK